MKGILFVLLLSTELSTLVKPNPNTLPHEEFLGIEVDGVSLRDIQSTDGDREAVSTLMGYPRKVETLYEGETWEENVFKYNSKKLVFYRFRSTDIRLASFDIINANSIVTIQGKTIKIGDPISNLGTVKLNDMTTGGKSIVFESDRDETIHLSIRFDQETKLITEILYYVLT